MVAGVSKHDFIKALEEVIVLTSEGVTQLELADEETVIIHFHGGGKRRVSIACDSGIAIVRDVSRAI